jgi:hypothetical protein
MITIHKSLLGQNRAPAPGMMSWPSAPFSLQSKSTTRSREVQFDIVVAKATRLIGPHRTRHAVSTQLKACHRSQNGVVLNRHGRGLPHRNLEITTSLSPPFPFECSTDPPTGPTRSSNSEYPISTHHNQFILLVHKRGALYVSGTYHSTSTNGYQLCIAVLVIKIIQLTRIM